MGDLIFVYCVAFCPPVRRHFAKLKYFPSINKNIYRHLCILLARYFSILIMTISLMNWLTKAGAITTGAIIFQAI